MDQLNIKEINSLEKSSEVKRSKKSTSISNIFTLIRYKQYFKTFIKLKKYNINHKGMNSMYLQSRDKYQKFVTNINSTIGLRFEGNKNYENLSLNNFKDDYKNNTINIFKELENNSLAYFKPLNKKEMDLLKSFEFERIKLTPIPFKNKALIKNKEERKKMHEIKRTSVFMRRVEYTHLIKNFKSKENEKNNLSDKIYILKGAILIIEDWWKKIIIKRKKLEREREEIQIINIDLDSKEKHKKNLLQKDNNNNSNTLLKNIIQSKDKKSDKLKKEINHISISNNYEKNDTNKTSMTFSNKLNYSTEYNKKMILSNKNAQNNNKKIYNKINVTNNLKNSKKNKKSLSISQKMDKNQINKNHNKSTKNISINLNIDSFDNMKDKIFKDLNKDKNATQVNTTEETSNINNHLKRLYTTESIYGNKDKERLSNSTNSYPKKVYPQNEEKKKKEKGKKENELFIKTYYDTNRKITNLNKNKIKLDENKDNKKINISEMSNLKNNNKNNNINNTEIKDDTNYKNISNNFINKKQKQFENNDDKINQNNKENDNQNKINEIIINPENNNTIKISKQFMNYNIQQIDSVNFNNNNEFETIYKMPNKKQEITNNSNNNIKRQEISPEINDSLLKQFENLKIVSVNETIYINKSKSKPHIISSKKDNSSIIQNNKPYYINDIQKDINNKNENDITNKQNGDSDIIPLEQDNQKNFIIEGLPKEKEIKNENIKINILKSNNEDNKNNQINDKDKKAFIRIKNYKHIKPKIDTNTNTIRDKSENNKYLNTENEKIYHYKINSFTLPTHIKIIYKLYRTKSVKEIKRKKYKRFEYLRTLHNKFIYE